MCLGLRTKVGISRLPWKSGNTDLCARIPTSVWSRQTTCDLLCCRSVIFFPAGRTPAGKKMTLRQHGRSCVGLLEINLIIYCIIVLATHNVITFYGAKFPQLVENSRALSLATIPATIVARHISVV